MKSGQAGFALLETLISFILMAMVLWVGMRFFYVGSAQVSGARVRTVAASLANETIELIRNHPYDAIGLNTPVPNPWYSVEPIATASPGIAQDETITRYGIDYQVRTYITYVDSPTDGVGVGDADGVQDYKRVFVTVDWPGAYQIRMSTLVTP
ncbi:MAG: type IV pilus modification PilV family protein [bacterium]